jgi:hypothetical protein
MNNDTGIPEQREGSKMDAAASTVLKTEVEARNFFKTACERLRNVNNWEQVCGSDATNFALIDAEGNHVQRDAKPGDYFRINIPGPGNSAGKGFDWVRVEEMDLQTDDTGDLFFIRVRPASPPMNADDDVAHFFKPDATSTFMIVRKGREVSAEVHGRNEKPNTDAEQFTDKVRNAVVGTASALGLSFPQWKMLVNGLVKRD